MTVTMTIQLDVDDNFLEKMDTDTMLEILFQAGLDDAYFYNVSPYITDISVISAYEGFKKWISTEINPQSIITYDMPLS